MKHVALFGAGRIGRIHAANIAALPGVRLKYVCDPVPDSAQALAALHGAQIATVEQVFADPSIEVVAVASPTDTHSDLITRAAAARKHIFCEKPIDLSVPRAEACAHAIREAGVACMMGFQRRFDPTFNEAQQRLARGEIGAPEMLVVTSRDPGAPPTQYLKGSGGIFRDMLIHDFDVFRWILCADGDEADTVYASGSCLVDPAIAEVGDIDSSVVSIRTKKGRLAQINTSRRAAYGYDQRFEVLGSNGMLQCGNHRPSEVVQSDAHGVRADLPEHFFLQRYREAYRLEVAHFFECLQSGAAFRTTIDDGVAAQKLADAATVSWQTGQVVRL
ncbi:MAG TPA: inositol 2-dehydrogenase [Burkholderiaceae bacterium]|nr:inositol 2-dehydrogenase [Burkholderiaceae bacterium]